MPDQPSVSTENVPPGRAARAGSWTVVNRDGEFLAVSSRCRHQLAVVRKGAVGAAGWRVCRWHGSRSNPDTGEMVAGPQGFATYQGPTPGCSGFVRWTLGRFVNLRR